MGGCRCTYRNCTVRSDGKSHMFHYPVFDRLRCHQWLTNAQRLEFLELRVSQLKNRVVCQYHFTQDCFMNYKMNKLRNDAVPTINGPYCHGRDWPDDSCNKDLDQTGPIIPDEIETEQLSHTQRQANVSVIYGDFLLNAENPSPYSMLTDNDPLRLLNVQKETRKTFEAPFVKSPQNKKYTPPKRNRVKIISEKRITTPIPIKEKLELISTSPSIVLRPRKIRKDVLMEKIKNESNDNIENIVQKVEGKTALEIEQQNMENQQANMPLADFHLKDNQVQHGTDVNQVLDYVDTNLDKNYNTMQRNEFQQNIGNILDAKFTHIENECMMPRNEFQPNIENIQNAKVTLIDDLLPIEYSPQKNNTSQFLPEQPIDNVRLTMSNKPVNNRFEAIPAHPVQYIHTDNVSKTIKIRNCETDGNKSLLKESNQYPKRRNDFQPVSKNKVTPERVAEIEEKRKFNKKLRDMIEFCLDDQDKPVKSSLVQKNPHNMPSTEAVKVEIATNRNKIVRNNSNNVIEDKNVNQKVISALSQEPNLPSREEYNFASLEARLKKMEDNLLRKIGQNTERIIDLKSTLGSAPLSKRSITTQTKDNTEDSKKQLYLEISKHLSPATSSLIYEELFLNKFSKISPTELPVSVVHAKRRKSSRKS